MRFNFQFGRGKINPKQIAILSVILTSVVGVLSQCTGAPQERLWDLLDEVQRTLFPQTIINDLIINDPEKLNRRVERDVDKAIRNYELLTKDQESPRVPLPRLIEKAPDEALCYSKECKTLGGEMRLCAPWALDCSPESVVK